MAAHWRGHFPTETSQQLVGRSVYFTFGHMTRTTPTITEDTTRNLEEIIKQQICNEVILYVVVIDGVILVVVVNNSQYSGYVHFAVSWLCYSLL